MKRSLNYAGIDVDDQFFHVAIADKKQGLLVEFNCAPNVSSLVKKLDKMKLDKKGIQFCYEAGYGGFSLCRKMQKMGLSCKVIAPSLIPRLPGQTIKNDRIDAKYLAKYYSQGLLTEVDMPNQDDEIVRDLLRSRSFTQDKVKDFKKHILALFRRMGYNYREEIGNKNASYWTTKHRAWLKQKIKCADVYLKFTLENLLRSCAQLEEQVSSLNACIENMSKQERYKDRIKILKCFRGLDVLSGMTLITEIGDVNRFFKPPSLVSYSGLDIREYSSGGKEHRYGISKRGNSFIRKTLTEASQFALKAPAVSRALKSRREDVCSEWIDVADRCMKRLHKKSVRMLFAGKNHNKIKIACAREMLGFIWEALKKVS